MNSTVSGDGNARTADVNTEPERLTLSQDEREIDLIELFYALLSHAKLIVIAAVIATLVSGIYTYFFITPQYTATSKLYVLNSADSVVNLSDLQIGSYLASDYIEVFNTWETKEMVRKNLGLNYSYAQMGAMVSASNTKDTRIINITVTSSNPQEAMDMANEYAKVVSEYVSQTMSTEKPNVFSEALLPTAPSSPNKTRNVIMGFMLGVILAIAYVVVRFLMDDKVKSSDDITKYTGMPVLAVVPTLGVKVKGKYGRYNKYRKYEKYGKY